uniref:Uncharacterized protein n=1 Tax=viral metagenome TaxID=1070528 RepID=A0A6M3ITB9_9ZZZZ
MLSIKMPRELTRIGGGGTAKWPFFVASNMTTLGRRLAYTMRRQLEPHRVTGKLAGSVEMSYDFARTTVTVGPSRKYGRWDAGLILQRGTRPIPNMPWKPIKRWAEFRGLPAFPVWYKIKTKGVSAHPFLDETLQRGDTRVALQATARRLGRTLAAYALQTVEGGGFAGEPTTFTE